MDIGSRRSAVRTAPTPAVSVIVPLFNEVENVELLAGELLPLGVRCNAEILVADDGSTDGSAEAVRRHPRFRYLSMPRLGKSAALEAGIKAARAPVVVTIDADLQEDPNEIRQLLDKLEEGWDCVAGKRLHRKDSLLRKRIPSFLYRCLILILFFRNYCDPNCGLRAIRTEAARSIVWFPDAHRLVLPMLEREGYKVTEIPIAHRPRQAGRSKYTAIDRIQEGLINVMKLRFGFYG